MNRLEEIIEENGCNKRSEIRDAMEEYARECIVASLKKASEAAVMNWHCGHFKTYTPTQYHKIGGDHIAIKQESITNENNIVLL